MLDQKDEAKMEKFVDTMPTIIQTHLVLVKIGQRLPRNENNQSILLENVAALPTLTQDTAVPNLYSPIAHSKDKEETEIPQLLKGAKSKQTKNRGRGKDKQQQQKPNPPTVQTREEQYTYEDAHNYYK